MKVLIVDDETLIREGLASTLAWNELGIDTVLTAEDGEQALALFQEHLPELVLTDICMPFIDGLQFTEQIRNLAPDTCIIIISGYDEFSYAQTAVRLNVFEYVLKPIFLDKLSQTVRRAVAHLRKLWEQRESCYYEQIFGSNDLTAEDSIAPELDSPSLLQDCDVSEFAEALRSGYRGDVLTAVQNIRSRFTGRRSYPRILVQVLCSNLFLQCKLALEKQGGELELLLDNPMQSYREVISQPTIDLMFDKILPIVQMVLDYQNTLLNCSASLNITAARQYIDKHYTEPDFSLNKAAEALCISACHFSTIFKKATGGTFISYLTNLRIQKARELLRNTNLPVYEIAERCGYDAPAYFSTLFKKTVGVSPNDYRKQL